MSGTVRFWKDPLYRAEAAQMTPANPAGNVLEELTEQDFIAGAAQAIERDGGCDWWNVSCHLGNKGSFCTLTVECMPSCN